MANELYEFAQIIIQQLGEQMAIALKKFQEQVTSERINIPNSYLISHEVLLYLKE